MAEFWKFAALGLGSGSIYALVALGIVLVYRGSGVVNFANGAMTLTGAATYHEVIDNVSTPVALAVGVGAAALMAVLINLLVMTPLRRASPLARIVATLGVATCVAELWKHRVGLTVFVRVDQFLPHEPVHLFGTSVVFGEDRLWIMGITVALFAALAVVYRRTRFGLATAAVAENEHVAAAQGWSPVSIASLNWAIGGGLAGFAGIILSTITGLSPDGQMLVIVPALAAALVGGFSSFPLTLVGGLLIGVLESVALIYTPESGYANGLQTAVPFLVILTLLIVRGRALPLRNFLADRLPSVGSGRINRWVVLVVGGCAAGSLWLFSTSWSYAMVTTSVGVLVTLSLVVLAGYAGQLSLMQWTMAGIGALVATRFAGDLWGLPFLLSGLLGVVFAVVIGMVISLPALRIRGVTLAVATLALGHLINTMVIGNAAWTGGAVRGTIVRSPSLFGWSIDLTAHPQRYALVSICVAGVAALIVANLRRGRSGRRLIAVRDNERAAASLGLSVLGAKMYAFGVSSMLAAAGGVLVAYRSSHTDFGRFDFGGNINSVIIAMIGGIGWISGGILGGVMTAGGLLELIINHVFYSPRWYPAAAAFLLVVTVIVQPDGIVPKVVSDVRRMIRRDAGPDSVADIPSQPEGTERVVPRRLEIRDLTVRFGGIVAVDAVSLSVAPGEVVALIGPNGAGKTTLIDAACGFVSHRGLVTLDEESLNGRSARRRARAGLTRSFQSLELFEDLTVEDNLRLACDHGSRRAYLFDLFWPSRQDLSAAARAAIQEFQLNDALHLRPSELPYATRRLVAIARAVAGRPSIILLDEPAAGLDESSTAEMAELIRRLATDWGMGVLLVEHDMDLVMRTCDRIVALNFGQVIAVGTPDEIRRDPAVIEAYLGAAIAHDDAPASPRNSIEPIESGVS